MRRALGGVGLLALVLAAGCIDFEDAQAEWCTEHPGACPEDGGTGLPDAGETDAGESDGGQPDAGLPDAGVPWVEGRACTTDEQCGEEGLCHLAEKVCVRTCTSADDCLASSPVCAGLLGGEGGAAAPRVCQCFVSGGEEACTAAGGGSTLACAQDSRACVPACVAQGCALAHQVCDTQTGRCVAPCGGPCAEGTFCDTGLTPPMCVRPCTTGACADFESQVCEHDSGLCVAGPACEGTGKSTCDYAQHCAGAGHCRDVPQPTCPNLVHLPFDAATSRGPIIYAVELAETLDGSTWCGGGMARQLVRVRAYRVEGSWPETKDGLTDLSYVNANGEETSGSQLVSSAGGHYEVVGMQATILVSLCTLTEQTSLTVGFYFTGGNASCQQLEL